MSSRDHIPTLDDVAKAAGVSTATVSRCLNKPDAVSIKARAKVLEAVEKLGYTPNFGAQIMAAKRTSTIGAIIPTMENAIFARGLQAFQEELHTKGYTLLVSSTAYNPDNEADQIKALVARGADGLLLIGYERDPAIYEFLRRRGLPTLIAWAYKPDSKHPTTGFDNRASMRELANHVLSLGHKDIAIISGILKGNDRATERFHGIRDALRAHGLEPDDTPIIETSYEIENGAEAFATLMAAAKQPTVVMCGNDVLAVGAIQRAHEMGLNVPEDISITGFDDIELARIVRPQLTTVHVPHREMGLQAAQELVRMVENQSEGKSTRLESTLQIRGSLRPLKS